MLWRAVHIAAVRCGRWLAVASAGAAFAVLAGAAPAASISATPARHLRVYGYPYAARCPAAGVAERVDRWRMDMCNRTSYVAWALQANGQRIDWFIPGAMDAWNWPHVARLAGLRVDQHPQPGAVGVWAKLSPPFGHVGYVTAVDPEGGFEVSEYNSHRRLVSSHSCSTGGTMCRWCGVSFIDVPSAGGGQHHIEHNRVVAGCLRHP
jgi:surface antigen